MSKRPKSISPHWQTFADLMASPYGKSLLPLSLDQSRERYRSNTDYCAFIGHDDVLQLLAEAANLSRELSNMIKGVVCEMYQTAGWMESGRRVVMPSESLFALLEHSAPTVPGDFLRPPFSTFYLKLPKSSGYFIPDLETSKSWPVDGVYVSCTPIDKGNPVTQMIQDDENKPFSERDWQLRTFAVAKTDEDNPHPWVSRFADISWANGEQISLDQKYMVIRQSWRSLHGEGEIDERWTARYQDMQLLRVVMNVMLYMTCRNAEVEFLPGPLCQRLEDMTKRRVSSKRRRSVRRQIEETNETFDVILGSKVRLPAGFAQEKEASSVMGSRKSPRPHFRVGHFHHYWLGSGDAKRRELRWIEPVIVRKSALAPGAESEVGEYTLQ